MYDLAMSNLAGIVYVGLSMSNLEGVLYVGLGYE